MGYNIRYLPSAFNDIDTIGEYLSKFYPNTSKKVLDAIRDIISRLKQFPYKFEEYEYDPFFRHVPVSRYVVFYHVNEEIKTVDIHRVLRGAWDIEKHLAEDDI